MIACVCGSVQGEDANLLSNLKKMAGSGANMPDPAKAWAEMGEQVKANKEAVKASMAGSK
jgi:hypothetical protein